MDADEIERLKLHRLWFTWPSWVFYAWYLDQEQERLMRDIESGAYRL